MAPDTAAVQLDWQLLEPPDTSTSVRTRTTSVSTESGPIRIGLDSTRRRHLLLPVESVADVVADRSSRGILLIGQRLEVDEELRDFADLVCLDPLLNDVFHELSLDICRRIQQLPDTPLAVVGTALGEWRELLRASNQGVPWSKVVGLFGELEMLHRCAQVQPLAALSAWRGPTGGTYDFQRDDLVMEVKTTTAHLGNVVTIHGPDQVDPPAGLRLHVCVMGITPDDTGVSVVELVEDIRRLGVPADEFADLLSKVGYTNEQGTPWHDRFRVARLAIWRVDDDFPGVRRSDLPAGRLDGVRELVYSLDLDAARSSLDLDGQAALIEELAGMA